MASGNIDSLNFEVLLDDDQFKRGLEEDLKLAKEFNISLSQVLDLRKKAAAAAKAEAKERSATGRALRQELQASRELAEQYVKQRSLLRDLSVAAGGYLSVQTVRKFLSELVGVTGEFETQRIALSAMLGDAAAAEDVLSRVRKMALKSPFTFQDLSKAAKQLTAFGSAPGEIVDELQMIADLAAGVGADMGRIILAYGQIRSATVLRGQELRQLTEAGLPIMEELARVLSETEGRLVNVGEIFDLVSKRAVSFGMVQQAFKNMTSEGGRFFNMQAELASSIEGKISNLRDAFDDMLRTIGEDNRGAIAGTIDATRKLIENYRIIGKLLAGLITTYGTYKAAIAALDMASTIQRNYQRLQAFIRLFGIYRKELGLATAAQKLFNVTSMANVYIALGAAIAGVVAALVTFRKKNEEALRTAGETAKVYQDERRELEKLVSAAMDEKKSLDERKRAVEAINSTYGDYLEGMRIEKGTAEELAAAYDKVSEALRRKYLEEQHAAMTDTSQSAKNSAEAALWGYIQKIIPKSGVSTKDFGAITSRLQSALKPGSQWGAAEIFNEIVRGITDAGGKISNRQRGALYSRIWDFTEARKELATAEGLYKEFEDGFNAALASTTASINNSADQVTTKASAIAEGIKTITKEISELESRAKTTGLTDAEVKKLNDLRDDLDDQRKTYKGLTGEDYGKEQRQQDNARAKEVEDFYRRLRKDTAKYANEVATAEIEAMEDGNEKTLAMLDLQHAQRVEALESQYEDDLAQLEAMAVKLGKKFDPATSEGYKELVKKYSQAFLAETLKYENEYAAAEKQILDQKEQNRLEYLRKFGTLAQREQAIRDQYQSRIDAAKKNGDAYGEKLARKEMDEALADLEHDYSALYGLIFADAESLTDNLLAQAISETQKEIAKAVKNGGDIKTLTELYERLLALTTENTTRKKWGIAGILEAIDMLHQADADLATGDKGKTEKALADRAAAVALLKKSSKELANVLNSASEALAAFPGMLGKIGEALKAVAENAENLITALTSKDRGEIATSGIAAASNLLQMVGNQIKENKQTLEDWERALRSADQAARMRLINEAGEMEDNIFGVQSPYAKSIAAMAKYSEAMEQLVKMRETLNAGKVQVGTEKVISGSNIGKGAGAGAAAGAAVGSFLPGVGTAIGAAVGAAVGAITGAAARKTQPVFESLIEHYGQIVDENLNLNPKILDDYDLLDETTKQIVDNWEEIRKASQDAIEEMHSNLQQIVGDMADEIRESLVQAWKDDRIFQSIDAMRDHVTKVLEEMIEKAVFAAVFAKEFEKLQKRMEESLSPGGDQNLVDDMAAFMATYPPLLDKWTEAMKSAQETASAYGVDLWQNGSGETVSLASGISKELVERNSSLIASYMNGLRADVAVMRNLQTQFFTATAPQMRDYMTEMLAQAQNLNTTTQEMLRESASMYARLNSTITTSPSGGSAIRTVNK